MRGSNAPGSGRMKPVLGGGRPNAAGRVSAGFIDKGAMVHAACMRPLRERLLTGAVAMILLAPAATAQGTRPAHLSGGQAPPGGWHLFTRTIELRSEGGRDYVAFVGDPDTVGLAWSPALAFTDGDIEFDVRGRDIPGHSFVGIAFHIADDTSFDAVYLRPFNFQAADSARHAHAVQFVSSPAWPWDRLRTERPGQFEKAVPGSLDPSTWIHVRVRVHGPSVDVYLSGADTPVLSVVSPSSHRSGGVGYFVHGTSVGDFRDLTIRPPPR